LVCSGIVGIERLEEKDCGNAQALRGLFAALRVDFGGVDILLTWRGTGWKL
jgi:hypothetical protein